MTGAESDAADIAARVLAFYPAYAGGSVAAFGGGLVNRTFLVTAGPKRAVLQQVNAVFSPVIHRNIQAVTERLAAEGMVTPRLVPAADGALFVELPAGGGAAAREVWRMMTHVDGVSFDVVVGPAQARAAGRLVGRFHRATDGLSHRFEGMRAGVHDSAAHLARLRAAVTAHAGHRLASEVAPLAAAIDAAGAALPPLPRLPDRVCHGDPKFNNVLFAGSAPPAAEEAVCLVDLDTVGPMQLAHELGDAWRSWCNRAGEDRPQAELDLDVFAASAEGYLTGLGRALTVEERRALVLGVEWVSLELAARFAADALEERYFRWDPRRFASRADHNLVRAQGQWSLHQAMVAARPARERTLNG